MTQDRIDEIQEQTMQDEWCDEQELMHTLDDWLIDGVYSE